MLHKQYFTEHAKLAAPFLVMTIAVAVILAEQFDAAFSAASQRLRGASADATNARIKEDLPFPKFERSA